MFWIFWITSTLLVFFILYVIFNIDARYANGSARSVIESLWVGYLILLLIPFLNLLICLISVIGFVIVLIAETLNNNNFTGDDVLKKIFFIKDEKK